MTPRCSKCNAKLAEAIDGTAIIKCWRCKTICVLRSDVKVESAVAKL